MIGIVIPTLQAASHLTSCLKPLVSANDPANLTSIRILVVDSSSTDDTVAIARSMGVETLVIPRKEFNHGKTRELGRKHLQTEIVIMMTQDAYLVSPEMIYLLAQPIIEGKAAISYGRQIPHIGASIFGSFPREFNYPAKSHLRSLNDAHLYGSYTFFCSNTFAAYSQAALDEIDGFPQVSFGEDSIVTAKFLQKGKSIAYVAEAMVHHSHDYTLREEFLRHYTMGSARNKQKKLLHEAGTDSKRGREFAKALLKKLWRSSPTKIPYAILHLFAKWSGYRLGGLRR